MDNDEELYELQKQVYVVTKWRDDLTDGDWDAELSTYIPEYTSDYLLERLPGAIQPGNQPNWLTIQKLTGTGGYVVAYRFSDDDWIKSIGEHIATSPQKALLRLTLALSESGELRK